MRKLNECPKCKIEGEPIKALACKPVEWRCEKCGLQWDCNDDFICVNCSKEVPGYYLFCSPECSKTFCSPECSKTLDDI